MEQVPFSPNEDAKQIKLAISKPQDLNKLINIVAYRSNSQRQEILKVYYNKYNINLIKEFNSELSGKFLQAITVLFYTPVDYDCHELRKAMKGLGTNKDTLIEILATRSNQRISDIKIRYPQLYEGRNLIEDIKNETSGFFRNILLSLLEGIRPNNPYPNEDECDKYAKKLYESTTAKNGTEESIFINIFTKKSREEFALISKIFYKWYRKTLFEVIENLFSGDINKILKTIAYTLLSPSEYFAHRINNAITGFLTNDDILIRVLVSRYDIDIEIIKKYYNQIFKENLFKVVNDKFKGEYKNLLLALIRV